MAKYIYTHTHIHTNKHIYIHAQSHAGYYPGAETIFLKLIFNPDDGKIYGAQAVGKEGVEKRVDVIATAMMGDMTVNDLAEVCMYVCMYVFICGEEGRRDRDGHDG